MECFAVFLLMLAGIVFVAILAAVQVRQSSINETYERLARQFGGRAEPGGWFGSPTATFMVGSARVYVDLFAPGGQSKSRYTQVHLDWPDARFRMEVFPRGVWYRPGRLIGMEDLEVGWPRFDDEYIVRCSEPDEARNILTGEVQHSIEELRYLLHNRDIYIGVGGGELLVKKLSTIRDFDDLLKLVQLSVELHRQALVTQAAGIDFTDESSAQPIDGALCQVCGDNIEVEMVVCRRCKTPHHLDCWHYFGRCSTYGCNEPRYYVPPTASPQ